MEIHYYFSSYEYFPTNISNYLCLKKYVYFLFNEELHCITPLYAYSSNYHKVDRNSTREKNDIQLHKTMQQN